MNICFVASSPIIINAFLYDQIRELSRNHNVTVITNTINTPEIVIPTSTIDIQHITIQRKVSIISDITALYKLYILFKANKFDLIYSVTPKAGLLSMVAGYIAKIRCRIHIFTGQVWATRTGLKRNLLKCIDKVIVYFSTNILADSFSQKEFLVNENIIRESKILVLANGSISGVDTKRFSKNNKIRSKIRNQLGIENNAVVFLFLGRLNPEKGIMNLIDAFSLVRNKHENVYLIIVGPDEAGVRNQIDIRLNFNLEFIHFVNYTNQPENYMNAADVLCIPSYREGFGSVVIEAAAVGIPAIGTNIYGLNEAILNKVTGLLCPVKNTQALFYSMQKLILDSEYRCKLGVNAKNRVEKLFSQDKVTSAYVDFIQSCLAK